MIIPGSALGSSGSDALEILNDPLGDRVQELEKLGQKWLDRAADAVDKTRDDIPVEEVKKLMREGKALPINLKEELEELGERCEVYCVCETAYDASMPMISCDACEGWFHYECCDMCPPSPDEPENENNTTVHFKCPPCCRAGGEAYVPFRPPPDRAAMAAAASAKAAEHEKLKRKRMEDDSEEEASEGDTEEETDVPRESNESKESTLKNEYDFEARPEDVAAIDKEVKEIIEPPSGRGTRTRRRG
jgi:histone demethylase JARID1